MRLLTVSVLVALVIASPAYSDELMDEALKNCDKNQLSMNFCARHFYEVADAELNGLFRQRMATLGDAKAKDRFRDAQRAWVMFRDKDCLFQVPTRDDSRTDWPMLYWACMRIHSQQRVVEIKEFIKCTYDNCFQ
jgi:uncharacterized protein YecT (DUF1311 family)